MGSQACADGWRLLNGTRWQDAGGEHRRMDDEYLLWTREAYRRVAILAIVRVTSRRWPPLIALWMSNARLCGEMRMHAGQWRKGNKKLEKVVVKGRVVVEAESLRCRDPRKRASTNLEVGE